MYTPNIFIYNNLFRVSCLWERLLHTLTRRGKPEQGTTKDKLKLICEKVLILVEVQSFSDACMYFAGWTHIYMSFS